MAEPRIPTSEHCIQADFLELTDPMSPETPNSTSLMTRRRQTVLSMIAASLIGAALGIQIWNTHAGWFLAVVIGLATCLLTSGMISIALHGSALFEAVQASMDVEPAAGASAPIEDAEYLSEMKTEFAAPRLQHRLRTTTGSGRRTSKSCITRPARTHQRTNCADALCV